MVTRSPRPSLSFEYNSITGFLESSEKPYRCEIRGCEKAYKNANGLKYHKAHGHCIEKLETEIERNAKRPYRCAIGLCRKQYKNLNGLKYHIEHTHIAKFWRHPK